MKPISLREIEYPDSDGEPMGETQIHIAHTLRLLQLLQHRYDDRDVLVASNLLAYWVEGNPLACVCPDVFVVLDCPPDPPRRTFRTWEEGRVPNLVVEITSKMTRLRDLHEKPEIYAEIGIGEYFLFDPTAEYLDPTLQGYRLHDEEYVRIEPDAEGRLAGGELGIVLQLNGRDLELHDSGTGERLLTPVQAERVARARAEADRQIERTAREAAEAELARLRRRLADLEPDSDHPTD